MQRMTLCARYVSAQLSIFFFLALNDISYDHLQNYKTSSEFLLSNQRPDLLPSQFDLWKNQQNHWRASSSKVASDYYIRWRRHRPQTLPQSQMYQIQSIIWAESPLIANCGCLIGLEGWICRWIAGSRDLISAHLIVYPKSLHCWTYEVGNRRDNSSQSWSNSRSKASLRHVFHSCTNWTASIWGQRRKSNHQLEKLSRALSVIGLNCNQLVRNTVLCTNSRGHNY